METNSVELSSRTQFYLFLYFDLVLQFLLLCASANQLSSVTDTCSLRLDRLVSKIFNPFIASQPSHQIPMDPIFDDDSLVAVGDPAIQVTSELAILLATAMALGTFLFPYFSFHLLTQALRGPQVRYQPDHPLRRPRPTHHHAHVDDDRLLQHLAARRVGIPACPWNAP